MPSAAQDCPNSFPAHSGSKAESTKPLVQTGLSLEALNLEMPGLILYESTNLMI